MQYTQQQRCWPLSHLSSPNALFLSATYSFCVLSRFTWKMPTFPGYSSPCELTSLSPGPSDPCTLLPQYIVGYSPPPHHLESQMITIDFLDGLWFIFPSLKKERKNSSREKKKKKKGERYFVYSLLLDGKCCFIFARLPTSLHITSASSVMLLFPHPRATPQTFRRTKHIKAKM